MTEVDNEETVTPTRSLFGSAKPAPTVVSEGDTVADQPVDEQPVSEEAVEDAATFMDSLTVDETTVSNEPEPETDTVEEAGSVLEEVSTEPEAPVELTEPEAIEDTSVDHQSIEDDKAAVDYHADAIEASLPVAHETTAEELEADRKDIAKLDVATLKEERKKLDTVILSKQEQERRSVMSQIAAVVKLYDIPLLELFKTLGGVPNPRKGEKAPITHRDESGNTWTGRGKTPKWLKDKNPDDYRVK